MTAPRRGRLLILGLPYFGRLLEGVLRERGWQARYLPHPGRNPLHWAHLVWLLIRADVVYLVGSRIERGSPQDLLMRLRRRPIVIHWVGSDVQRALRQHERRAVSARIAEGAVHWSDAPWLADELGSIGVRAEYVALPVPAISRDTPPLPAEFRVLLYLPSVPKNRQNFDMDTLLRLPADFPDVEFTVVPSPPESLPQPLPPNLEALSWVDDMDALYRRTSVHIRLTLHDGMSFMVLEALSRGRHVIWTFPVEGAIRACGYEAVRDALASLYERHRSGTLGLNEAGARHALTHFDFDTLAAALDTRLQRVLTGTLPEEQ